MTYSRTGVLPRQELLKLMEAGYIKDVPVRYVNPASIDLPLSAEAYRLTGSFLPGNRMQNVRQWLSRVDGIRHDLASPLERGVAYLIRIEGSWSLPEAAYAYANPKSSTGRLNVLSRIIADTANKFDALPPGWGRPSAEMWALVRPDSFPVKVFEGVALSQIRIFTGKSFLSPYDMEVENRTYGLLFDHRGKKVPFKRFDLWGDAVILTISVGEDFGWECRGTDKPLCLREGGKQEDYFEPIHVQRDLFMLRKGAFYIVSTSEQPMVPPHLSAELRGIDYRFGDMQVHRAGYIDAGWGYGRDGEGKGRPITLEITPNENIYVENGQLIARLRYEHMYYEPDIAYDAAASNYTAQNAGAMLSKYLK